MKSCALNPILRYHAFITKLSGMTKHKRFFIPLLVACLLCSASQAAPEHESYDITIMADPELLVPLQRIAHDYARRHQLSVGLLFTQHAQTITSLEEGLPADVMITASIKTQDYLWQRGLVDVTARRTIALHDAAHYQADVIAGEHMDDARKFVQYLASIAAKPHFSAQGFTLP
jgi:ABC-type molybdate transport system substrate-binding protein